MLNRGLKITRKHTENKALILEAIRAYGTNSARGGATTLNVMYEVYISYNQARHYLIELLQGKMIEQDVVQKNTWLLKKAFTI